MGPWALGIPLALVSALGLLLNAYVLLVVISLGKQTQQQQTANTLLLIHLGAVEVAVCFVLLVFATGTWPAAGTWCALHGFLLALLHPVALWTVTGLNCDRYYAIAAPLHYSALVSPRRVTLGLAISWAGALLLCLPPFSGLVPPYRYVPGLGCCAPDFGANGAWGSAGSLYGAVYAFLGLGLPALLVTVCNLRVLGIARYHRHRIASAIYEVTLSAQVTITHQRNPFFVPAVTAPAAGGPPKFHSAASTVMQLVGSLYLLYFPYCGLILWEACGGGGGGGGGASAGGGLGVGATGGSGAGAIGAVSGGLASSIVSGVSSTIQLQQQHSGARPRFASLASLLLACSPPINGLLYGLKSRTLRRSVQNYWRKKATKSELQQEIQARTPSAAGSRRPSGSGPASTSFFPFPPLQRRLSEALLALGNCRAAAAGFGSGNIVGVFQRNRLQAAASCNTLRVPNAELGETGRLVRSSASAVSLMAAHYRSDFGTTTTMMTAAALAADASSPAANGSIASPKKSPRILITRAYSEESQDGGASPLLRRHFVAPISLPPCEKRKWRHRSTESDSSTGSSNYDAAVWTTGVQAGKPSRGGSGLKGSPESATGWPCGPGPGGRRFTRVKTLEEGAAVFSVLPNFGVGYRSCGNNSESSADTDTPNTTSTVVTKSPASEQREAGQTKPAKLETAKSEELEEVCTNVSGNGESSEETRLRGEETTVTAARSESSGSWSSGAEDNSRASNDTGLFMHPIGEMIENSEEEEEEEEEEAAEELEHEEQPVDDDRTSLVEDRVRASKQQHHPRRKSRGVREAEAADREQAAASQLRPLLASSS